MKSLSYWIQRADFSATDYEPVDASAAVRAFATHDWAEEMNLLSMLDPLRHSTVHTKQDVSRSDVIDLITYFFEAQNDWMLRNLGQ